MSSSATESDSPADLDDLDDVALLSAIARRRDGEAFATLCDRYQRRAFNLAFSVLRDATLAEDAVQEAMIAIWTSAATFQAARGTPGQWILSIAMNQSYKLGLSRKRRAKREERTAMDRQDAAGAVESADTSEAIELLRNHVERLPDLERTILASFYGAGMSHQKIAEMVGMPRRTITDRIQQALKRLRGELSAAGVAAAAPLLNPDSLFEAMTDGRTTPPGLVDRVIEAKDAALKSSPRSQRSTPRKSAPSWHGWAATGIVLTGAVVAAWTWWPTPAKTPVTTPLPAVVPAPSVDDSIDVTWDLTKGLPPEFQLVQGQWSMSKDASVPGLAVDSELHAAFFLQRSMPRKPLRLTMVSRVKPGLVASTGCYRRDGSHLLPCGLRRQTMDASLGNSTRHEIYILDRHTVAIYNGTIFSALTYDKPFAGDSLCFTFSKGGTYQTVSLKTISGDEIPALLRDPDAAVARMKGESLQLPGYHFNNASPPVAPK